ncbi:MAG: phasin family protein [Elusimicrobiota bacterium]
MKDNVNKILLLGIGALAFTKDKAEELVNELISKGEVARDESSEIISRLVEKGKETRKTLEKLIREEVAKLLKEADIATGKELKDLKKRINKLEEEMK